MFIEAFPIFSTPDLDRALGFYRDLLDGRIDYQFPDDEPEFVSLLVGASRLGIGHNPEIADGPGGQRVALWVYVEDCDKVTARLRTAGVPITQEPTDQPWGERMARVLDPDGNEVLIGQHAPA